jgi:LacI family transcriptional regulator
MANIKDVAKAAGVSIATVSYALNDKDCIGQETKQKILEIAEDVGYVPNALAQGLLKKKTGVIGLVVPEISYPYISAFVTKIEAILSEKGIFLLMGSTKNSFEKEKEVINSFIARKVDGLIISPGNYYDENAYKELASYIKKRKTNFVLTNLTFPNLNCNYVVPDLKEGAYRITNYVLSKGYKDLIFVGGNKEHYYSNIRFEGFKKAMQEKCLSVFEEKSMACNDYTYNEGYRISKELIKNKLPEAIIAVNDMIAYGIIEGLKDEGICVPRDIKITGFDNIEMPIKMPFKLTTVNIPLDDMARMCVDILGRINEKSTLSQYKITPQIIEGDTI